MIAKRNIVCCDKILVLIVFLILIIYLPAKAGGQMNSMIVQPSIVQSEKALSVAYEIRNMGNNKARHLTVTTFLAGKTNRGDSLGDLSQGNFVHYRCDFDTRDLLPGVYTMATRLDFADQNVQLRRAYHFSSVKLGTESIKNGSDPLGTTVESPYFNRRSFWHPRGKFALTLKNNGEQTLEPVIIFFLADGLTVSEPEKVFRLKAGEEQKIKIPLHIDQNAGAKNDYWVLVWHETNGKHYSQLIDGTVRVEDNPFYFKFFLIVCAVMTLVLVIIYIPRRRKGNL